MIFESEDNWNAKSNNTSRKHSISILSPTTSSIESIGHNPNNNISSSAINRMTNHSKFDNLSSEYNPSHNRCNSNRHTPNKYLTINPYYNMEDSNASSSETKIQILKSIDNDGVGSGFTSCTSVTNNTSNSNNNNFDIDCFHYPLREAMNQDLIDLLRSQISKLLEENEKLVSRIDDYRQKIAFIERDQRRMFIKSFEPIKWDKFMLKNIEGKNIHTGGVPIRLYYQDKY
ncbi:hypothetical protein Smp_173110 [Schistosoma mansoni]|uniref:hypothetical protein n=1 Tax=Schistosoma mansoni TaxID=6183 RepID=UPI00019B36D0|nr:hypothetical protein Smp_173110 [Schistosoma mansoni]|eukprot:XP_018645924.1 hypothetical protein Smp_173110 [Schistosoma mansoni]